MIEQQESISYQCNKCLRRHCKCEVQHKGGSAFQRNSKNMGNIHTCGPNETLVISGDRKGFSDP